MRLSRRLWIKVVNWLSWRCEALSEWLEEAARLLRHCPDCGENLWYGKPCPSLRRKEKVSVGSNGQ